MDNIDKLVYESPADPRILGSVRDAALDGGDPGSTDATFYASTVAG